MPCYSRFTSWPPFMSIVLAWRMASNTSVPTSIWSQSEATLGTKHNVILVKFLGTKWDQQRPITPNNQRAESLHVPGPDIFRMITLVSFAVLSITASAQHLGRCPGRLFDAAQSNQLSSVLVARVSVTDEENLKATNYCWQVSDAGGFIPNKDAGRLLGGFSLWAYGWTCSAICGDDRLNALLENEPVQNELSKLLERLRERLHQHSFADDFQDTAPLHVFQHQYKEGFCLT